PFSGNKIPTNRLDAITQKLQTYYPLPNVPGATTLNNYYAAGGPILSRNYVDAKINFNANDREAIWGKYGRMWATSGGKLRFGFDLVRHHLNHWQPEIGNGPRGYLGFGGGPTTLNGGPAGNQYNSWATFLLGLDTATDKSLQNILSTGREWQFGWYLRDRW